MSKLFYTSLFLSPYHPGGAEFCGQFIEVAAHRAGIVKEDVNDVVGFCRTPLACILLGVVERAVAIRVGISGVVGYGNYLPAH